MDKAFFVKDVKGKMNPGVFVADSLSQTHGSFFFRKFGEVSAWS